MEKLNCAAGSSSDVFDSFLETLSPVFKDAPADAEPVVLSQPAREVRVGEGHRQRCQLFSSVFSSTSPCRRARLIAGGHLTLGKGGTA